MLETASRNNGEMRFTAVAQSCVITVISDPQLANKVDERANAAVDFIARKIVLAS